MLPTLKEVLMQRDGMLAEDADALIEDAKEAVRNGAEPEEVLSSDFGLEPDFIFELIDC